MSENDNGGPAFPAPDLGEEHFSQRGAYPGMTLRDYFATQAMQAYVSRDNWNPGPATDSEGFDERIARYAYEMADAMLKTRLA